MSNQDFKRPVKFYLLIFPALLLAFALQMTVSLSAGDTISPPAEDKQIFITSDHLVSDRNAGYAEFTGNVRAEQGKDVITSDSLKILFSTNRIKGDTNTANEDAIEKIVANGNVKINFDNRLAVTEQAVYNTSNRVFVLTGENSKVTTGKNFVTGRKITIHRDSGHISFERGNNEQVEAVIHTGNKEIQ